jgi:hypothetical protein
MMISEASLGVDERASSLFQPDSLLPTQYFDTFRRKSVLEPEKRLMLAVLEDAVACFQKHVMVRDAKGEALFRDVEQWILGKSDDWLFSFENICESLGFNAWYIRQGLISGKSKLEARPKAQVYRLTPRRAKKGDFFSARKRGNRRARAVVR